MGTALAIMAAIGVGMLLGVVAVFVVLSVIIQRNLDW